MRSRTLTCAIIAILACGSDALAGGRGRAAGVAGAHRAGGSRHIIIIRRPFPIQQPPASAGTAGIGASPSMIDSQINSRIDGRY